VDDVPDVQTSLDYGGEDEIVVDDVSDVQTRFDHGNEELVVLDDVPAMTMVMKTEL
jgi:hypothetical protein